MSEVCREDLLSELGLLRERMAELEDLEVQRITDEQERFDSLNVLDEYAQQLEVSRDKLARLLRAGVAIEEARDFHSILQTVADAVGAAGWASAVVYLFDNFEIVDAAYCGVCDEDIADLVRNRRSASERARMYSNQFDEFKISRSYFIKAERLQEAIGAHSVVPGRRQAMPGDDWDPMDLVYVPMYSSTGRVIGNINCDDPVNGKRPTADVFQYLEIFADLAARKIETVRLLNRQAQIESQLRESEEKYRTIFDRSADSFLLMDDLFRECNDATLKIFGCEYDDIIGHSPV
ncbi:MAG: PAS domain-containing protein [bacterium]|nr:PAS domain-containing protein [bacterium]